MDQPELKWLDAYRKRGDPEALHALVEHSRRPLYAFIHRMVGNPQEADDIFQETWFRAIRSLDRFKGTKFMSWLFRIAHNLVIDRARKHAPEAELADPTGGEQDPFQTRVADPRPSPADQVHHGDLARRIAAAVDRLPPDQREIFLLRTEADMPFKEIAKMLNISINTALARMQYALRKLRVELQGEYDLSTGDVR